MCPLVGCLWCFSPKPGSQWCLICQKGRRWTLNVCSYAENPSQASLSSPPLLFICSPAPHPPQGKGLCVVWESVSPSLLAIREGGVATKEIPKVPLQWHRQTLWKLASTRGSVHTCTLKDHQESLEFPLFHYNNYLLPLCESEPLTWNLERRDYFMFLQALSCVFSSGWLFGFRINESKCHASTEFTALVEDTELYS